MPSLPKNASIRQYQEFIKEVYGLPNDRHFSLWDMVSNVERFAMRGLKGIRKRDPGHTKKNLLISLSWFLSIMNRLHVDIEEETWNRYPFLCSYCASCPCQCKEKKVDERLGIPVDHAKRPKTLEHFQEMMDSIYPHHRRTIDHAGVHLAEEIGEFSEAVLKYRGAHKDECFNEIRLESADVLSNFMTVFNSLEISMAEELALIFSNNCHVCHKAPCECSFEFIVKYES